MSIDKESLNPTADLSIPPVEDLVKTDSEEVLSDSVFTGEEVQVAGLGGMLKAAFKGGKKVVDDVVDDAMSIPEKQVADNLPVEPKETSPGTEIDQQEQIKAVFDEKMLPETPDRLEVQSQQKAEALLTSDLDDYADFREQGHLPNFDVMQTEDDVKAAMGLLAEKTKAKINAERREVIPDEELKKLAYDLDMEHDVVREVMSRESGTTLMPEQIIAARQMLHTSAEEMVRMAKLVNDPTTNSVENKLKFRRQMAFHREYTAKFMGARAEAGRALRAYGIPLGSSADQAAMMDSMLSGISGNTAHMAQKISQLDNPAAVQKMLKRGFSEKFMAVSEEIFINSILSGMKTQLVNIGGNALFQGMDLVERTVAAGVGKALSTTDRATLGEVRAQAYATVAAFQDAMKMAGKAFKTGESSDMVDKLEFHEKAISSEYLEIGGTAGRIVDFIGTTIRLPTERGLTTMDEFFKELARRGELSRIAYRDSQDAFHAGEITKEQIPEFIARFVDQPPEAAMETANAAALYKTFQQELGQIGRGIQELKQKTRSVAPVYAVVPFIKTPVNILKAAIAERSPLGLFSQKIRDRIADGGPERDLALARMAMGTGTIGSIWMMADNDLITGSSPSGAAARRAWQASGKQEYSIFNPKTGKWHSYARAEPLAYIIGSTADAHGIYQWSDYEDELSDADQAAEKILMMSLAAIVENTSNKTFMRGLADFTQAMAEPERYFESYANNLISAHIPFSSLRRDVSKIQDPLMKDAWTLADKVRATSGLPGWSENVPDRLGMFGETIEHAQGDALGVLSPFPVKEESVDPVRVENARFLETIRKVPITMPSKNISGTKLEAAAVKLDVRQYNRLISLSRNELELQVSRDKPPMTFNEALLDVIESSAYSLMGDYDRYRVLRNVQEGYDKAARNALLEEDVELMVRLESRQAAINELRGQ